MAPRGFCRYIWVTIITIAKSTGGIGQEQRNKSSKCGFSILMHMFKFHLALAVFLKKWWWPCLEIVSHSQEAI
jgi:hypothetical protein